VRVASRYYKGPELLVDDKMYHYSLDIWSTGCTMAGMIFRIETFFKGTDNFDQLFKIVKVLGEADLNTYRRRYNLTIPKEAKKLIRGYDKPLDKLPWASFISDKNRHLAGEDAVDLLDKML
jgi:casein kinase II subunit alpha